MKSIGLLINPTKAGVKPLLAGLKDTLHRLGVTPVAPATPASEGLDWATLVPEKEFARAIDVLVTLGGDGTILRGVHLLRGEDVPLLGINLGNLGFLTTATAERMSEALAAVVEGRYTTTLRSVLSCRVTRGDACRGDYRALNDIVAGWGQSTRIISLHVKVNDENVTSYRCDGIIVSTPTGSTGHSLSAGGPILHPEAAALLINVICPHTLSARPMVIPDDRTVRVEIHETSKELLLSVDGNEVQSLVAGDVLTIQRSVHAARLIQLPGHSYFDILRQKLQWSGSTTERGEGG
ncbi:MAG TPA: NAD(+)/NADH kinase [Kiritimatiellia bacterium]|nr:NAD(+)/NADH kinase [Kiritimatiellia bacterium]